MPHLLKCCVSLIYHLFIKVNVNLFQSQLTPICLICLINLVLLSLNEIPNLRIQLFPSCNQIVFYPVYLDIFHKQPKFQIRHGQRQEVSNAFFPFKRWYRMAISSRAWLNYKPICILALALGGGITML